MIKTIEQALLNKNIETIDSLELLSSIETLSLSQLNGLKFKYSSEFEKLSFLKNSFWEHLDSKPANISKYFILIGSKATESDFLLFVRESEKLSLGELGTIHWRSIRFLNRDKELIERLAIKAEACIATSSLLMFICILTYRMKVPLVDYIKQETLDTFVVGNRKWIKFCSNYLNTQNQYKATKYRPSKPLKFAILFSGQFRGYEQTLPGIIDKLIKPLNADVFIHSWKQIGFRVPTSLEADRTFDGEFLHTWRDYLIDNDILALKSELPNLFAYLEDIDHLCQESIVDALNPKKAIFEDAQHFQDWSGAKCMHYKMHSCFHVASNYSDYDFYIRVRADKELLEVDISKMVAILEQAKRNYIAFQGEINTGPFGIAICDQFAIGDYEGMANYHGVYNNEGFFKHYSLPGRLYQPHSSQAFSLLYNHVEWGTIGSYITLGELRSVRPDKNKILKYLSQDKDEYGSSFWKERFIHAIKKDLGYLLSKASSE
ncbi:hypothetical protein [Vibrio sp. CB1-14]|uniref:Uncharacterized protein n=1 Tax=Vibrio chaetopteri TaxID=3016528 RepID=A0AAU8BIB7_9VIBR